MVDLLFLASNRLAFTRESWAALLANTDWSLVSQLSVYDDNSVDGTRRFLAEEVQSWPGTDATLRPGQYGSPVVIMRDWIPRATARFLAKIDNDTVVPAGWLNVCLRVMRNHPDLDLLGIEAMYPSQMAPKPVPADEEERQFSYVEAPYIGGIGVFRREAFSESLPGVDRRWFGFTAWQQRSQAHCGWLLPSIPVFLLDRLPFPPWSGLNATYIAKGWQRPWPMYTAEARRLWQWRFPGEPK